MPFPKAAAALVELDGKDEDEDSEPEVVVGGPPVVAVVDCVADLP